LILENDLTAQNAKLSDIENDITSQNIQIYSLDNSYSIFKGQTTQKIAAIESNIKLYHPEE